MNIPNFYLPPFGLPLRWQDEQSGVMPRAVKAYLDAAIARAEMQDRQQFLLVREWLRYYITAPCWRIDDDEKLDLLRVRVEGLQTTSEVSAWIMDCLELSIDPL